MSFKFKVGDQVVDLFGSRGTIMERSIDADSNVRFYRTSNYNHWEIERNLILLSPLDLLAEIE
jgi:hypothetical protein